MPQRLIQQTKFAELCGFTKPHVNVLLKKQLKGANVGDKIDLSHPSVIEYLKKRSDPTQNKGAKRGPKPKKPLKVAPIGSEPRSATIPEEFADYADWTIRQVLTKFGTEYQFKEFLSASKIISAIKLQELEMSRRRGEIIERDLVDAVVIKGFETLFLRILAEGSKKISRKVHAMTKSGSEPEECEAEAKQVLSKLLKTSKDEMVLGMTKI